jgi:hypothetical protein
MEAWSSVVANDVAGLLARDAEHVATAQTWPMTGPQTWPMTWPAQASHPDVTRLDTENRPLETIGIVSAAITPRELCNTASATGDMEHDDRVGIPIHDGPEVRRMEKRTDPWGDFLRRLLLSASLAGTALSAASAAEEPEQPAAEVAEAEQPVHPLAIGEPRS